MVLKKNTLMIIDKLNENIITIKEPTMDSICNAKNDIGRPNIIALFLIFR